MVDDAGMCRNVFCEHIALIYYFECIELGLGFFTSGSGDILFLPSTTEDLWYETRNGDIIFITKNING